MSDLAIRERVAREVMGLPNVAIYNGYQLFWSRDPGQNLYVVPEYPTDIAAAWLVVEKMREKGCVWIMSGSKAGVLVSFAFTALGLGLTGQNYKGEGPTAPLAICLAALAALATKAAK